MGALPGSAPSPEDLGYDECLHYGWWLTSRRMHSSAFPYYQHAASMDPTGVALTSLGSCLRKLGEFESAVKTLRAAIAAPQGRSTSHARVSLAATLLDMSNVRDATDVVIDLLREDTDNVPILTVGARCAREVAHSQTEPSARQQMLDVADALRMKADRLRDRFESEQEERSYRRSLRLDEEPLFLAASIGFPARFEVLEGSASADEATQAEPAASTPRAVGPISWLRSLVRLLRRT